MSNKPKPKKEKKEMIEQVAPAGSMDELILAIQNTNGSGLLRNTMNSPKEILDFIENESGETLESLAEKAEITQRELLLAIRDSNDVETRKKIAEALHMTYYAIFGK